MAETRIDSAGIAMFCESVAYPASISILRLTRSLAVDETLGLFERCFRAAWSTNLRVYIAVAKSQAELPRDCFYDRMEFHEPRPGIVEQKVAEMLFGPPPDTVSDDPDSLGGLVLRMQELGDCSLRHVEVKGERRWYLLREVLLGEANKFKRNYIAGEGKTPETALLQALGG